jgi:hypothetical protein
VEVPVLHRQVPGSGQFEPHNVAGLVKQCQVFLNIAKRHIVEWPHGGLDQLHQFLGAAVVVAVRPQADPQQACTQWQRRHVLGGEESWLDRAHSCHLGGPLYWSVRSQLGVQPQQECVDCRDHSAGFRGLLNQV